MHQKSDVETGLFYCNSRYYVPEWCRWLTPDDVEYLEPDNINGLNLYCYCKNNSIGIITKFFCLTFTDKSNLFLKYNYNNFSISETKSKDKFSLNSIFGFEFSSEFTSILGENYYFFIDFAFGKGYSNSNKKFINLMYTIPSDDTLWKIWDYSFGFDFHYKGNGIQIFNGTDKGFGWYNKKGGFAISFDMSGRLKIIKTTNDVTDENSYDIKQLEINTHNIVGTIMVVVFAPQVIPIVSYVFCF